MWRSKQSNFNALENLNRYRHVRLKNPLLHQPHNVTFGFDSRIAVEHKTGVSYELMITGVKHTSGVVRHTFPY